MNGSERKEERVKVSGKDILAVIEKGPEFAFNKLQEFNNDVQNLTRRMSDLYHQDDETATILSLLGVKVTVKITIQPGKGAPSLIGHYEVGARLSDGPIDTDGDLHDKGPEEKV